MSPQYDFGDRFEMLLMMPTTRANAFKRLQDYLLRSLDDIHEENLLDRIDREMSTPLANANEITLTIPEFRVSGDIDANDVLRKVRVNKKCFIVVCCYTTRTQTNR